MDFIIFDGDRKKRGVYMILNKLNGNFYIGSTLGPLYKRKSAHKRALEKNEHYAKYLQNSFQRPY